MSNFPPPPPPGEGSSPLPPPSAQPPTYSPPTAPLPAHSPPPYQAPTNYEQPLGYQPNAPHPAPTSRWQKTVAGIPVWLLASAAVGVVIAIIAVVVLTGGDDDKNNIAAATSTIAVGDSTPTTTAGEPTITEPETDDTTTDDTEVEDTVNEPDITVGEPSGDEVAGAPSGTTGTRESPVSAGEIGDIGGGWRMQVLDVTPDATALITTDTFNDPPPAGMTYTIIEIALGYYGLEDPTYPFEPTISAVGGTNVELDNNCGLIPGELPFFGDVFAGGVITGNICFVTSPGDIAGLTLYATGDFFVEDDVFFAVTANDAATLASLEGPQTGATSTPARLDPNAIGSKVELGEGWSLTVDGASRDVTAEIAAEGFSDPPPEGFTFIGVEVTFSYDGADSDSPFTVSTSAVGDSNVELSTDCGYLPTAIDVFTDVFAGGTVSGTLCFVAPAGAAPPVLYATAGFDGSNPVMFALS